ncbi:YqaA family protein [Halarchaeum salinum]|uniref:VTT domain-containing protein n=1 Tax=Halarchaeum salinum TaxID=489912 RepID=A0AAV3S2S9_9EURY
MTALVARLTVGTLFAAPLAFPVDIFGLQHLVETATGPLALLIVAVYSFLIAVVLPLPSEVVLIPAASLDMGFSYPVQLVLVMLASGIGKAAGSVVALYIGHGATHSGPVINLLRRAGYEPVAWSKHRVVDLVQSYGYIGLALALCVPFFPDTLSIYAFSVLESDYVKFSVATFAGSVGRLVVTVLLVEGTLAVL